MRHACLTALLAAALASPACLVHAAPFYEGKSLVHPVIIASQDSGADIAFIKEAGGVTGYYCVCLGPDNKPAPNTKTLKLDTFGKAEIRSVFYAALDRDNAPEHQTMLILLRLNGKPGLRAYRYNDNSGKYLRLDGLQPALDRIARTSTPLNAARVKAALAGLAPLDYSVNGRVGGKSGNADFGSANARKAAAGMPTATSRTSCWWTAPPAFQSRTPITRMASSSAPSRARATASALSTASL